MILTREHSGFPAPYALFPVVGTVLLITAGSGTAINRVVLGNPVANWFGRISYPLYLWHWLLISFPAIILSGMPPRSMRIGAVVVAVALAALTYHGIEKPIRRPGRLNLKAIVLTSILAVVGVAGYYLHVRTPPVSPVDAQLVGPLWKHVSNRACLDRYPMAGIERYGWWFCALSRDADPDVLLLGPSFANDHYPGMTGHPRFAKATVLSIGSCDAAWVEPRVDPPGTDTFSPCTPGRRFAQQEMINGIIAKGTIQLTIIDELARAPTDAQIAAIRKRVDFLESHGSRVVIFYPRVRVERSLKSCFARPLRTADPCELPISAAEKIRADFAPLVHSLHRTNPRVQFFDQNTFFCTAVKCSFVQNGLPVFRDHYDHLSPYASTAVADLFVRWLDRQPKHQ